MSNKEIVAEEYTCGGCGATTIVRKGERPEGYHGNLELVTKDGELGGKIFACPKKACLRTAVNAITGDNLRGEEPGVLSAIHHPDQVGAVK
jgi:hypothetical protein